MTTDVTKATLLDAPGLYVSGEDHLRLTSFNSLAGVELSVDGRFVDYEGCVTPVSERHVPNTDRTAATQLITLGEGFLSGVQVRVSSGAPQRGQTFVILELVRGRLGAVQPLQTLLQGYVSSNMRRAWPGMPLELSSDGRGATRLIAGTNPAANAECSDTVPAGARWLLRSWTVALVTDANVANRVPTLIIDDGATVLFESSVSGNLVASTTYQITAAAFGAGAAFALAGQSIAIPPDFLLLPGYRIRTSTLARQVGDDYGAPQILVEEWLA